MLKERRVTWPVLLVLVAFLAGSAYLVFHAHEDTVGDGDEGALIGPIEGGSTRSGRGEHAWRHHDWARDPARSGAPSRSPDRGERGAGDAPATMGSGEVNDDAYDPQRSAMRRSFRMQGDAGAPLPFQPTERAARIVDSEGELPVPSTARCEVRVLPVRARQFNCLVRVLCDGQVLYPNASQTAGYAPCDIENGQPVRAVDEGHTAADGDPLVHLDLNAGTVTVEDRGDGVTPFRATLRID